MSASRDRRATHFQDERGQSWELWKVLGERQFNITRGRLSNSPFKHYLSFRNTNWGKTISVDPIATERQKHKIKRYQKVELNRKIEAYCWRRCRGGPVAAYRRRVGCGCGSLLGQAHGWPVSEECDPHGSSSKCSHLSQRKKGELFME